MRVPPSPAALIARHFLKTPSIRFPLQVGGTEPLRASPREAGGNLQEGGKICLTSSSPQNCRVVSRVRGGLGWERLRRRAEGVRKWGRFLPPLGLIRVHRVDPKTPKQRGLLEPSPHPSPLPHCSRGERVREWGDSACEKPLRCAEQGWLMYTLIRNHAGEAIFRTPSAQGLTIPENGV
jgi:hypothetical protein